MNLSAQVEIKFEQEQLMKDFIKAVDDVKEATIRLSNISTAIEKIEVGLKCNSES